MTARRALSLLGLVALAPLVVLGGCGRSESPWPANVPVRVVVTIPPLASFVKNVAGPHAAVRSLCTTSGPHNPNVDVQDTQLFREANLFLAVGMNLDNKFADQLNTNARNSRLVYLKLGDKLPADLKIHDEDHDEHDAKDKDKEDKEKGKDEHGHEHGEFDPHVWLGIDQAVAMVEMIRDELKRADAAHAADYTANAKKYVETLHKLRDDGRALLKDKKDRKIISFHESLPYFAKTFGIDIVDTIETGPGDEPSAARLAHLVGVVKDKKVRVIAVEPQYPKSTSAEILRKELAKPANNITVTMVEVDPLETADPPKDLDDPHWYEGKMRHNLEELARVLP